MADVLSAFLRGFGFSVTATVDTGEAAIDISRRAMASEAHGYILKPFDERQLYTAIEMAFHKDRKDRSAGDNQQAMAAILRSLKDAVFATDLNGRVTFVNPAAENVTRRQQRSAVGQ